MGCTYVKDFDFKKTAGDMSAKKSGYAKGGSVIEKATGERYPSRKEMVRHEKLETPREQREELVQRSDVKGPLNRLAAPVRRSVPVAPQGPLIPMKTGGKVGKVMGEFGKGELHSGSKTGPVVSNPKQAVAIALSEARNAAKKR